MRKVTSKQTAGSNGSTEVEEGKLEGTATGIATSTVEKVKPHSRIGNTAIKVMPQNRRLRFPHHSEGATATHGTHCGG